MISAKDVAEFFIMKGIEFEEGGGITNLKLQKLLYYAKGFHQAIYNEPLFHEMMCAWFNGPAVPAMYQQYKNYGSGPITSQEYDPSDKFNEEQIELLNEVWSTFGNYNALKLRDMTHNEKPWLDHEYDATVIEDDELASYFKTRLR